MTVRLVPHAAFRSCSAVARSGRLWLSLICLLPWLFGCSSLQTAANADRGDRADGSVQAPPEPNWRQTPDGSEARLKVGRSVAGMSLPDSFVYSLDPVALRKEVVEVCVKRGGERNFLRSLVADLYFSGVDPAAATEALLLGDCGKDAEILEEMAAQGGADSRDAIAQRAVSVLGMPARRQVERALAAGRERQVNLVEAEAGLDGGGLPAYGMFYFPSTGEGRRLDASVALNRLFEEAVPGYGIYTFVLVGKGFSQLTGVDAARYRELFRVIETYVATTPEELDVPSAESHAFLVPVDPRSDGPDLVDLISPELSDFMRGQLRRELRRDGQKTLAARLDTESGPFLVATLEPGLLPSSPRAPRLVADLSGVGPEYLYAVVDAYDRPIPIEFSGSAKSLALIRERLLRLPIKTDAKDDDKPTPGERWIIMLGHFAGAPDPLRAGRVACTLFHSIERHKA